MHLVTITRPEYRSAIADLVHQQWSGWMRYMIASSTRNADGSVTIPEPLVQRWERQTATAYVDLSRDEQQSGLIEADRVIGTIAAMHEKTEAQCR